MNKDISKKEYSKLLNELERLEQKKDQGKANKADLDRIKEINKIL